MTTPMNKKAISILFLMLLAGMLFALPVQAQEKSEEKASSTTIAGDIELPDASKFFEANDISLAIKIVIIMSTLTLLPALVLTMTSFTRIMIILSFVKRAMGTQELPPHQIIVGFSIFLTLAIMAPVFLQINEKALEPYQNEELTLAEAGEQAGEVMSRWLLNQTRPDDIKLMVHIARAERPAKPEDVPIYLLVPAFALSELKTAFQMGFIIFLPFLIIDIVIASILLSMGMFMLPPVMISTPFKIILFVLVDGWTLVIASLVKSFGA